MEMNLIIGNGIDNPMYLNARCMNVDDLDVYYAENQHYVAGWMGVRCVSIDINGQVHNAIYVGTAGGNNNAQDYYFLPEGDAWAVSGRGEASAQIMGHAYVSRIARNGLLYAADWA